MHLFDGVFDTGSMLIALEVLLKLGIGAILGGAIGWEREKHGRPAGIRTHMLVVIGVVLFTEVGRAIGGDPGRLASQVVTGIGFLGAGSILRLGVEVKGLTTAASIWASAGIGMCVSMAGPFLIVALFATVLTLFTLAVVDSFERKVAPGVHRKVFQVELESLAALGPVLEAARGAACIVESVNILSGGPPFLVQFAATGNVERLVEVISRLDGLRQMDRLS